MRRVFSSITVIVLFLHVAISIQPVHAKTEEDNQAKHKAKVKKAVSKLGVGTDAQISVKLQDGRKIEGYVREIKDDGIVVEDRKTGIATEVGYNNVKQIRGDNLSTGAKIAIGVGIAIGVLVILAIIGLQYAD